MSGPNPPGSGNQERDDQAHLDQAADEGGKADKTGSHSQAYSAPESEQLVSGYVPADPLLYDYDGYTAAMDSGDERRYPRWPWVVGITTIIAAIALVASVAVLVARTETKDIATPETTTTEPPVQDEIITTTTPPPPPSSEEPPPPPPSEEPAPPPPAAAPPPPSTSAVPPAPRQVTYSVTGTKAPFDQITITYVDASGQRRTQRNAYIPWSLTLTPISQSEVGSVEASSLLRLSKLSCTITSSDGTVLSSNSNDAPQTNC